MTAKALSFQFAGELMHTVNSLTEKDTVNSTVDLMNIIREVEEICAGYETAILAADEAEERSENHDYN